MSTLACKYCKKVGTLEVDRNSASSDMTCTACGLVQEDHRIVSEVQFSESANGAATVQGSMVRLGQARANFSGRQNSLESREQTVANGQKNIRKLAVALRIDEHIATAAGEWFKLALTQNFVQGRRSQNVVAACLYVACRKECTHHMLIDFSSRLQISVYSLGATFLKMVKALQITKLPLADPSIFIQHFAEKLDFGPSTIKVVKDATKLVRRMLSDWIHEGRRPAGIAGACLLLAARMNNFRRTHAEIVNVAHVGQETLQRRLNEFRKTQSANLSVREFLESEGTSESKPPSFENNRRMEERLKKQLQERDDALVRYKQLAQNKKLIPKEVPSILQTPESSISRPATPIIKRLQTPEAQELEREILELADEDDTALQRRARSRRRRKARMSRLFVSSDDEEYEDQDEEYTDPTKHGRRTNLSTKERRKRAGTDERIAKEDALLQSVLLDSGLSEEEITKELERIISRQKKSIEGLIYTTPSQRTTEEEHEDVDRPRNLAQNLPKTVDLLQRVSDEPELNSDDDDDEVEAIKLDPHEVEQKTRIWTGLNHDFIIAQEKKRLKEEADMLTGNTSGTKKRRRITKEEVAADSVINDVGGTLEAMGLDKQGQPLSAADSAKQMLVKKSFSKKINYTSLDELFQR